MESIAREARERRSTPQSKVKNVSACSCQHDSAAAIDPMAIDKTGQSPSRAGLIAVATSLALAGAYIAYQRIGTTANVDTLTFVEDYAGGLIAVGMTDQQPGLIALSDLDRTDLRVEADRVEQGPAGRHTRVRVITPHARWQKRLRGPRIVLIDSRGGISSIPVEWTHADFVHVLDGLDCGPCPNKKTRACGQAFANLYETLQSWPGHRVPAEVRRFLSRRVQ